MKKTLAYVSLHPNPVQSITRKCILHEKGAILHFLLYKNVIKTPKTLCIQFLICLHVQTNGRTIQRKKRTFLFTAL